MSPRYRNTTTHTAAAAAVPSNYTVAPLYDRVACSCRTRSGGAQSTQITFYVYNRAHIWIHYASVHSLSWGQRGLETTNNDTQYTSRRLVQGDKAAASSNSPLPGPSCSRHSDPYAGCTVTRERDDSNGR